MRGVTSRTAWVRRALQAAVVLVLAAGFAACSDTTGPPEDLAGTYALISLDGKPLPQLQSQTDVFRSELTAAQLVLYPDSTFLIQYRGRIYYYEDNRTEQADELATGRWVLSGNRIECTTFQDVRITLTVSGSTLTSHVGEHVARWRRVSP